MTATTSAPSRTSAASGRTRTLRTTMRSAWNDPAMPYYLISVLVLVTVALGLVFVLSSSAVKSLSRGNAPYDEFFGQAQFALIGLPLAFAVSRLPVDFLKKFAWVAYFGALGLQLTPFFLEPVTANGNIVGVILGPITFQPGEVRVCASCHGVNKADQAGLAAPTNKPEALRALVRYWNTLPK